jgi:hypothetical protein
MAEAGLETVSNSEMKSGIVQAGGAESGAIAFSGRCIDAELARLIERWPRLNAAARKCILAAIDPGNSKPGPRKPTDF